MPGPRSGHPRAARALSCQASSCCTSCPTTSCSPPRSGCSAPCGPTRASPPRSTRRRCAPRPSEPAHPAPAHPLKRQPLRQPPHSADPPSPALGGVPAHPTCQSVAGPDAPSWKLSTLLPMGPSKHLTIFPHPKHLRPGTPPQRPHTRPPQSQPPVPRPSTPTAVYAVPDPMYFHTPLHPPARARTTRGVPLSTCPPVRTSTQCPAVYTSAHPTWAPRAPSSHLGVQPSTSTPHPVSNSPLLPSRHLGTLRAPCPSIQNPFIQAPSGDRKAPPHSSRPPPPTLHTLLSGHSGQACPSGMQIGKGCSTCPGGPHRDQPRREVDALSSAGRSHSALN